MEKPRYLEAITQNNSPRYDWGPKKRVNQFGLYAHLQTVDVNHDIALDGIHTKATTGVVNENYQNDTISNTDVNDLYRAQF